MGGLLARGIPIDFSIISDDTGQFNIFDHALCWIHAERLINRLIPLNECQVHAVDEVRGHIWSLYHDLKDYKLNPQPEQAKDITQRFQTLCQTKTCYTTLNQALKRMGKNQHERLRVLDKPYLPLHNTKVNVIFANTSKNEKSAAAPAVNQGDNVEIPLPV